jgi:hypothetical protein
MLRGRWKPDLPVDQLPQHLRFLGSVLKHGAVFLNWGTVQTRAREVGLDGKDMEVEREVAWTRIRLGERDYVIFPELFARLSLLSFFRARSSTLVHSVKSRALEWCKKVGLEDTYALQGLPQTVALAMLVSTPELAGIELLDSRAVHGKNWFPWVRRTSRGWWKEGS